MLGELLVRSLFGRGSPPDTLEVGLGLAGAEVVVGGYRRVTRTRGTDWVLDGREARTRVRFGPFSERVVVDEAWLFADGEPVEVGARFDPPREIQRGDEFEFVYHARA